MIRRAAPLPLVLGLGLALGLGVTRDARAERQESAQQLYKSGDIVKLAVLGVNITLPQAPAGWAVSILTDTFNYDVIERQDPTNPKLAVQLNRPKSASCDQIDTDLGKLASIGLKRRDPTPLAPQNWASWSWELPMSGGKSTLKLCTNTQSGPVLATVVYEAASSSLDPAWVQPLLLEIGTQINGHRDAPSSGGGMTMAAPTSSSGTMMLPVSNVKVAVPHGWAVKASASSDGTKFDLIDRLEPNPPWLFIIVTRRPGSCQLSPKNGAHFVSNPPYQPEGWKSQAVELAPSDGLSSGLICVDMGNDYITALVSYQGSLSHPDVIATRQMLAPVAESKSPGSSYAAHDDASTGGYDPDASESKASVLFEMMGAQFAPAIEDIEKPLAGIVGLDVLSTTNKGSTFGVGVELGAYAGYGQKKFVPWDVHLGVGPSIVAGPALLLPLFGVGADGGNTGDGYPVRVKSAVNYYYGGRASIAVGAAFSISAYLSLVRRSGTPGEDLFHFDKETRYGGYLHFRKFAMGVKITEYSASDSEAKARLLALSLAIPL